MSTYSRWMERVRDNRGEPSGTCQRCGNAPATEWGLPTDSVFYGKGYLTITQTGEYVPVCRECWDRDDEQGLDADARAAADTRPAPTPAPKPRKRAARKRAAPAGGED